jgi:amino acid adenylation domain-containing protein
VKLSAAQATLSAADPPQPAQTDPDLAALLQSLAARGIELWYEGDRLRFRAPGGQGPDAAQKALLSGRRAAVIALLRAAASARAETLPLSPSQVAMWFQHQQAPASCVIGFALRATGPLQPAALRHAVQAMVDRHAMLRATYHLVADAPVQRIAGAAQAHLDIHDTAGDAALHAQITAELARPFDLAAGPVLRATLFTDGQAAHTILLAVHHIAADGWSIRLLMDELPRLYAEAAENSPSGLARPAGDYAAFRRWQETTLAGAAGERMWAHWRQALAAPRQRTTLPADFPRPAAASFAGAALPFDLPAPLATRVRALAAAQRTTAFVVMLGAFQLMLAQLCGVRDVITGTPVLGRPTQEFLSVVGDFVNVLPVRARLDDAATVTGFLARLRATVLAALEAGDFPLPWIVRRLHPERDASGQALFNSFFNMRTPDGTSQGSAGDAGAGGAGADGLPAGPVAGVTFTLYPLAFQAGLFDLALDVWDDGTTPRCLLKYATDLFKAETASGFTARYLAILEAMTAAPDQALAGLLRDPQDAAAETLLTALAARDIRLALDGDRLRVNAPKGALDDASRAAIATARAAIIARLRTVEERRSAAPAFWRTELRGAPAALALPFDRPRPTVIRPDAPRASLARTLPASLLDRLTAIGRTADAGLPAVLLAAWQVLLCRICGQDDVVVAIPPPGPPAPAEGFDRCAAALPVRGRLAGNPAFTAFLTQVRNSTHAAFAHRVVPEAALREAGGVPCQAGFKSVATPDGSGPTQCDPCDLALTLLPEASDGRSGCQVRYDFAADLFDQATIARLADNFATLLASIAAAPATPIQHLNLLGAAEAQRLTSNWIGTPLAHDLDRCVHHLLQHSARLHPQRLAVTGPDGTLSYAALDAAANRLAHHLARNGARPGDLVAVHLDRTTDLPVALAAVLKAGCAYVPLDPSHPPDRLATILRDAGASCVITRATRPGLVPDGCGATIIRLDEDAEAIAACPETAPDIVTGPADLAYVIYTSGSTGRPKGVEVEHRNLVAFLEAMRHTPGLTADDVLLAVTTIAFDIAGLEIWLPLAVGARIVLASRAEATDGTRLAGLIESHGVTVLQATPATWRLLLGSGWPGLPGLRALCGGEALPRDLAARLIGRVGALWNLYGPTETTVWSTTAAITAADLDDAAPPGPLPIGRPIANTSVQVVDESGRPVPVGVAGELLIGGQGVARGYRGRPDLTARAFVTADPAGTGEDRIYRTGDIVRFRADGQLQFLGRRDHQVKLRGYRIEPGEIEAALARHPGVTACIVTVHAPAPGEETLAAYVTLAPGAAFDPAEARAMLRAQLPDYMVPGHVVVLPALPLTPNGKIDRAALSPPGPSALPEVPSVPMTPAQQRVAALWRDVLRLGRVGLHDNFFDLGGHSLLLVRLQAGLQREFGCELKLVELFAYTTVAGQADWLDRRAPERPATSSGGAEVLQRP